MVHLAVTSVLVEPRRSRRRALRSRWRESDLHEVLARRRLRTGDLPVEQRLVLGLCLVSCLLSGVVLVVQAAGYLEVPSVTRVWSALTFRRPVLTTSALLLGLTACQATVGVLALSLAGPRRLVVVAIAVLAGLAPAVFLWNAPDGMARSYDGQDALARVLLLAARAVALVGSTAVLVAAVLFVRPLRESRRKGVAVALLVSPYLLLSVLWVTVRTTGARLTGSGDTRLPDEMPVSTVVESSLELLMLVVAGSAMAVTLWQVAEATRAVRDTSTGAAVLVSRGLRRAASVAGPSLPRVWTLLSLVLVLKLCWAGAGLAGHLPAWLGGRMAVWGALAGDGRQVLVVPQ